MPSLSSQSQETNRIAGEIDWKSSEPAAAKAQSYFERTRAVARQQQAKSWELRAAKSMARLWRDQGKRDEARELPPPSPRLERVRVAQRIGQIRQSHEA
jgi:hypothetical protein